MNERLRPVVVLFYPDEEVIASLRGLTDEWRPIAVINAIDDAHMRLLHHPHIEVLVNSTNIGLAQAFNRGITHAFRSGADYVMLLDQDTRPLPDMANTLLARADRFVAQGGRLGCIGPRPVDRKRPEAETIAPSLGPIDTNATLMPVSTIISSGMIIPRSAVEQVGGMWNELFIDHIDHEWCFRAAAAGLEVLLATDVLMAHDMGDEGLTVRGRYKPIHRSPVRHYHIVRNTLWLAQCSFIPRPWRIKEVAKLAYRIPAYLVFSSARWRTLKAIGSALWRGVDRPPARTLSA